MKCSMIIALTMAVSAYARPLRRSSFTLQNGEDAIALKYVLYMLSIYV
jgi:hypothetical protein